MRIAYFTDTCLPEINGVTNTLAKLSAYLDDRGVRHMLFAPDYDPEKPGEKHESSGHQELYRFPGIKVGISPNSRLAFPSTKVVFDLCDSFAPDVVHVTTEFGMGYKGVKYALSRGLPLVMSYHTDYINYLEYFGLGLLEPFLDAYLRRFYSSSNKTLAPSRHTLSKLREKGFQNLGIWSRGIDTARFSPAHRSEALRERLGVAGKFTFLYLGRLSPEKGLDTLLYAIERINRLYPGKAAFVFTGDGPYADVIRQANLDNVVLTGFLRGKELSEIYASADCFAFPSGTETFGNTCLEALASGLPVVAVEKGGVTDYLVHECNALLGPCGDGEAFTKNLLRVMGDRELRARLADGGIVTARQRDWNSIFDGLMEQYEGAIAEKAVASLTRAS